MKEVSVLILVVALAMGAEASPLSQMDLSPGLSVKFGFGFSPGSNFFMKVPLNISEAEKEGWYQTSKPPGPKVYEVLVMLCYELKHLCALYDPCSTYVVGLQHGIPQSNFTDCPFDLLVNGYTEWTTINDGTTETYYTITQYYVSELTLRKSCDERKASYNTSVILQEGNVYAPGAYGNMMTMSGNGTEVRTNSLFTQQACIVWMGTHYYYNMSKTTECSAETINPWFLLVRGDNGEKQEVAGCCMMTFGKLSVVPGIKDWFERPGKTAVQAIVNNGPQCLYDMGDIALTSHVYFTDTPQWIIC